MKRKKRVVILGAGVSGLAAAYRLSKLGCEVHVIERAPVAGGACQSFRDGDFILDYGPHKFYTLLDGVLDELDNIMGPDLLVRDKAQHLYMYGKYFSYPLKMSEMVIHFPIKETIGILMSFGWQTLKQFFANKPPITYEEFITQRFGSGLYQRIFEPMARKVYGDPAKLDKKLAEVRISSPGLLAVVKNLLFRSRVDKSISAPKFHYPKQGFGMIPQRLQEKAEALGAKFYFDSEPTRICHEGRKVRSVHYKNFRSDEHEIQCDELVYTIPISAIGNLLSPGIGPIGHISQKMQARHTVIYYFLLRSKPVLPSMWVFFPEQKFRFGRLSEMTKFSPYTVPEGHTALMVDFTCEEGDPEWRMNDTELGELLLGQLEKLDLFTRDKIVKQFSKRFRSFYPVYQVGFQENLMKLRQLESKFQNIYFIGRHGDFNYNNSDQCLDMGFKAADFITSSQRNMEDWHRIRKQRFDQYRIVD